MRALPALVAYALVLLSSPAGHAGLLGLHLAVAEHGRPAIDGEHGHEQDHGGAAVERGHGHESQRGSAADGERAPTEVRHTHGGREHTHHEPAPRAQPDPPDARPALDAHHAHGGVVHTHQPVADEQEALLGAASEFYLAAAVGPDSSPPRSVAPSPGTTPAPLQVACALDPPPPRA